MAKTNAQMVASIHKMLNLSPPKPRPTPTPRPTRPQVTAAAGTANWTPTNFAAKHHPKNQPVPAIHAGKVHSLPTPKPHKGH